MVIIAGHYHRKKLNLN